MTTNISRRHFMLTTAAMAGLPIVGRGVAAETPNVVWPAIIVGSGYGGAVSAYHLAHHRIPTLIIEMGKRWPQSEHPFHPMLTPGQSSIWLKNWNILPFGVNLPVPYYTGVLDRVDLPGKQVYVGRGYGGGSLVNGGMAVVPKREYFREVFPCISDAKMYGYYYPLAQRRLKVNKIDPAWFDRTDWYKFARVGIEQAHNAKFKTSMVPNVYDFRFMQGEDEVPSHPRSALAGEVIMGNNYGKRSLDRTYLASAESTGYLAVQDLSRVVDVRQERNGEFTLSVEHLNTEGVVSSTSVLRCKRLLLSAGSLGTTELLLRARASGDLPNIPDSLGEGWGDNGNIMTGRGFVSATGASQSSIPVAGIDNWSDDKYPFFAEIAPVPTGVELYTSLYLAITRNPNRGRLLLENGNGKLSLDWPESNNQPAVASARHLVDRLNDANGGFYAYALFPSGTASGFTYHPLGGALLGSVTDHYGRVKGHKGLYVMDGSLIPGNVGVNPFLTITALAERNMSKIIKDFF